MTDGMGQALMSLLQSNDYNRDSLLSVLNDHAMFVLLDIEGNIIESADSFNRLMSSHSSNRPKFGAMFREIVKSINTKEKDTSRHDQDKLYSEVFNFQSGRGVSYWFEISVIKLEPLHQIGESFLVVLKDVSALKEALGIREQFLSNMSHELRTPLHSLISLTNLLGETILDHEQIEYVQNMRHSCEVLLKMVDNLLDLNQLETGRLTFSREAFSFHHLIEKVCGIFKIKAEEKGLEILIFNDVSIPDYLIGDSFRLKQILLYLIENAINFTERGAITISTRMVKKSPRNVEVEFSVCDTGVGISPKKMEQMFEKFNQALILNQRSYGGPGLGLTIAKKLIELQGGSITLKSSERKGTEVLFKIKYAVGYIAPAKSITSERITNVASKKPLENMKVLIAEDVDINRLVIGKHMQKLGYQFDFAENGKIAFEKVRDNHYDIVLMDMQMPVMDGYEAIRMIRNELPPEKAAVPIISVTASVLGDAPQKCREAGADDYVPKPYSVADLQNKMEKLVANGKAFKQPEINERKDVMAEKLTNLEYLEQMADGDNEFIESMISYFITNAPVSIEDMKTNMNQGNWEMLRHVAHKYKPQLNFMGIQSILEDVETIEQNANKVKDTDKIPALLQKVERVTFQAIEELKNMKPKS